MSYHNQFQHYGPVDSFSPLDHSDPARPSYVNHPSYSSHSASPPTPSWGSIDGDLSGYEMHPPTSPPAQQRPGFPQHGRHSAASAYSGMTNASGHRYSSASTLFPSKTMPLESQSFLDDPMNHIDPTFAASIVQPYKDHSGRQLRHLLLGSSFRWFITAGICAAYIMSTRIWVGKGVVSETSKREYNAITTALSIALGLNISSAFKDLALNMRWPILASRKRNLVELDLILNADSLTKLAVLAYKTPRPRIVLACLFWLLINILAQAGIASLSLTYGFNSDLDNILLGYGNVSTTNMDYFYPIGNDTNPTPQDQQYIAHLYGQLAYDYGFNESIYKPNNTQMYRSSNSMLWVDYDDSSMELVFVDTLPGQPMQALNSIYTDRSIQVSYKCSAHEVLSGGTGNSSSITVANLGEIIIENAQLNSIVYFVTEDNSACDGNPRCGIVQAFEPSETQPWYYICEIGLADTQNDPNNYSYISDEMAFIASSAIAQSGYITNGGMQTETYPRDSFWGSAVQGNTDLMGQMMSLFSLGSIAGAFLFNPYRIYFQGALPVQGSYLQLGHSFYFYVIMGLICSCQLVFCTIAAIYANKVMVGPDSSLDMALLLRPIADALHGVSGGENDKAFRAAKKSTLVRYEKSRSGRWILNMTT